MASAGIDKLKLGLERLARADNDPDLLGAALTSIHGALEDRFRHLLASTPEVPAFDQARVLDVTRVQWSELIDLMRLHRGLSAEDATLIRTMNRERQSVAHGGRFSGKRVGLERYAALAQTFFPEHAGVADADLKQEPLPLPTPRARAPRKRATPPNEPPAAAGPETPRPRQAALASATARKTETSPRRAAPPVAAPARLNPGLGLTLALVLILACIAGSVFLRTEMQRGTPSDPTVAPLAPPLPAIVVGSTRITTEPLNLRREPGESAASLAIMPVGASVTLLAEGPLQDGHHWVQVRFGEQEGWADTAYLREP